MKVIHFLDSLGRGGAEMQVLDVCRNGALHGMEITLVAAGGGVLEGEFRNSGVEFVRLQRRLPIDPHLVSQLRGIVEERNIDVVHGYQAVEGLHLYLATRSSQRVRRVLSFQGFIPGRKNRVAARFAARWMDANITVSRSLLSYLGDEVGIKNHGNFHVIYNGADPQRLTPSGKSVRQELDLTADDLVGVMVANFVADPTKDQVTVCRALPAIIKQFPNFHFVFAGRISDGSEHVIAKCRRICQENDIAGHVHFLGARSDIPDILAAADIFVFSSRKEGFPVAVSEAMLAGVAMVVSDIEPLLEASSNGKYAEVFPVGNENALADKVRSLLHDKSQRIELASKAKAFATDNFSIDAHLRELMKLYRSLK